MNQRLLPILTAISTIILAIKPVQAAVPGQNIWEPIGLLFVSIWPEYSGATAQLIDAIILFVIITLTVVEVSKKTSVPKTAGWGIGIAMWLAAVIPLQQQGILLFEQSLFAFVGFLITTLFFMKILKGLFTQLFGEQAVWAQWMMAASISLVGTGSLFGAILQSNNLQVSNDPLIQVMTGAVALAIPLAFISAAILATKIAKKTSASESTFSTKDTKKASSTANKLTESEQKDQELLKKHNQYLEGLLRNQDQTDKKLLRHEQELETEAEAVHAYIGTLMTAAQQFRSTISQYRAWMNQNNANLPKEYYLKLQEIADGWRERLSQIKEKVSRINNSQISEPDKNDYEKLQKEIGSYKGLSERALNHAQEAEELSKKVLSEVENLPLILTKVGDADGIHRNYTEKILSSLSFKTITQKIGIITSNLQSKEEQINNLTSDILKAIESMDKYYEHMKKLHGVLKDKHDTQAGEQLLKQLSEAVNHITTAIETVQTKEIDKANKYFKNAQSSADILKQWHARKARMFAVDENYVVAAQRFMKSQNNELETMLNTSKDFLHDTEIALDFTASLKEIIQGWSRMEASIADTDPKKLTEQDIEKMIKKAQGHEIEKIDEFFKKLSEQSKTVHELHVDLQRFESTIAQEATKYYKESVRNKNDLRQEIGGEN